jgi:hypothetical protein
MKRFTILLLLLAGNIHAQNYPFTSNFVKATITYEDSTKEEGFIDWQIFRGNELRFKKVEAQVALPLRPKKLIGFKTDSLEFISIFNIKFIGMPFVRTGLKSSMNETFAEVVHRGEFNIYKIMTLSQNVLDGRRVRVVNFIFERYGKFAAYAVDMQMSTNRMNKMKKPVLKLFEDYPAVKNEVQYHDWTESTDAIVNAVKSI